MSSKLLKSKEAWAVEQEARQGLAQTVAIFRACNMSDVEIAELFRSVADELDPPIAVTEMEIN